ncbi:MAG TPA: TolC family protein, partial [Anaeromyxobacteraceae bacterium]|nr:TolC family protein [Anaeromyxobacteraceae bacterium]
IAAAQGAPFATGAPGDPVLQRLIEESLDARPELKQAQELVRAERERVPQAGALPDPVLSLGIQNDGFKGIQVGKMETSYYQVMVSQGIPWPGKRGLRTEVADLGARQAEASVARARLTTEADVRRAYLDLILTRERLGLLDRLESIWQKSAGVARSRYEAGDGAQSDVLRSQLELNRIRQRRWLLQAEERTAVQTLDRLRGRSLDQPVETTAKVSDLPMPVVRELEPAVQDALARSPELALAKLGVTRAEAQVRLASRERFPDLGVNAGIMPRGGLEPMWQAGVSIGLPIWSSRKQGRAVAESEARAAAETRSAEAIEQVVRLRVAERLQAVRGLAESVGLYRDGLLTQSQATAESTLAQYRVGKVTFASVLEANAGLINDEEGCLLALASAERVAIADAEISLEPAAGGAGGGMGGAAVPGAGPLSSGGGSSASAGGASSSADAAGSSSMSSKM